METTVDVRPQVTMWTQPRATFRRLLDGAPTRDWSWALIMAAWATGAAFVRTFDSGALRRLPLWLLVPVCLASGLIFGPLQAYLMTGFLRLVGRLSDKPGTFRELRTAYAWSFLPNAVAGLLLSVLLVGVKIIIATADRTSLALEVVGAMAIVAFLALLIGWGWSLVLLVIGVSEAHRTTTAEGFFQVLGAAIAIFVVAFAVGSIVVLFIVGSHGM